MLLPLVHMQLIKRSKGQPPICRMWVLAKDEKTGALYYGLVGPHAGQGRCYDHTPSFLAF